MLQSVLHKKAATKSYFIISWTVNYFFSNYSLSFQVCRGLLCAYWHFSIITFFLPSPYHADSTLLPRSQFTAIVLASVLFYLARKHTDNLLEILSLLFVIVFLMYLFHKQTHMLQAAEKLLPTDHHTSLWSFWLYRCKSNMTEQKSTALVSYFKHWVLLS